MDHTILLAFLLNMDFVVEAIEPLLLVLPFLFRKSQINIFERNPMPVPPHVGLVINEFLEETVNSSPWTRKHCLMVQIFHKFRLDEDHVVHREIEELILVMWDIIQIFITDDTAGNMGLTILFIWFE